MSKFGRNYESVIYGSIQFYGLGPNVVALQEMKTEVNHFYKLQTSQCQRLFCLSTSGKWPFRLVAISCKCALRRKNFFPIIRNSQLSVIGRSRFKSYSEMSF